ncbi:MAG: helix-turn-helix domain-containing protein [Verrucomicrobiae bacterium]|nr:helix-turn-helix domain-containing protein [Verrucomicrobiae bacterium]
MQAKSANNKDNQIKSLNGDGSNLPIPLKNDFPNPIYHNKPEQSEAEKDKSLIDTLLRSQLFHDFSDAYNKVFGLPLTLRPVESWMLPLHNVKLENLFCSLVAEKSSTCSICLQVQKKLSEIAINSPESINCPFGLCDSAIPIRIGEKLIGYLQTGQVFIEPPKPSQFRRVLNILKKHGLFYDTDKIKNIYYSTPIVGQEKYNAIIIMLNIFSKQLVQLSNQLAFKHENAEPVMIKKAREYINLHQTDEISLVDVAKHVNASTFYFCKMFKKYTGLNFTEYVSRLRVERAKNLLLNPNIKICDIAYEVGFQSLTHFNRVFKKITGLSPTEYRDRIPLG